jgi:cyclopropane-fatty-acyl-phospholipid synthase
VWAAAQSARGHNGDGPMANRQEIEATYDWLDQFQELRLGKFADITAAFFDGDFSKTLDQAQKDKHAWVFEGLGVSGPGRRVLDIGCGWGPILAALKDAGSTGVGLTLSSAQVAYCRKNGLHVDLLDWKEARAADLGAFDAVVSIGAFEHFCSEDEYNAGKQDEIYRRFFDLCAGVLPVGGRLYLQTMTWGKTVPVSREIRLDAAEGTPQRILARLRKMYPGSWLPSGKGEIVAAAAGHFKLLNSNNGRKDYIETLDRWGEGTDSLWTFGKIFRFLPLLAGLVPRYVMNGDFRIQIESIRKNDQQRCFIDEIMTHERLFFEKVA